MRCATCGAERPAHPESPCPGCLLKLGLAETRSAGFERLGPYSIVSPLGTGGMGEVYRARDSRLHRDVAIKVLPDSLALDHERIERFRREARVAASLNHPHIAAIYGFEEEAEHGVHFLVMELVEGITLAERLSRGTLPIDEALRTCAQIAAGLEAAHERGIVHRDLKPANVKVAPDGTVKLLDFGLAKATEEPTLGLDPEQTTTHYTTPGLVLGTAPYMSPEQARGRVVDRRADIWSLGCVLYECLTGKRAFDGETASDVMAKVLEREPDWKALPARTPPRVRDLLERCLEKDPKRRLKDSGDARLELERALEAREWTSSARFPAIRSAASRWRPLVPWAIAGLMTAIAILAIAGSWNRRPVAAEQRRSAPPLRVAVSDPDVPHRPLTDSSTVAVSPDGLTVAYMGGSPGEGTHGKVVYIRRFDEVRARPIEAPAFDSAAENPFFSRDGRALYFSNDGLYRFALGGGRPSRVAQVAGIVKGGTAVAGGIVFSPAPSAGLVLAREDGGPLETLTVPDAGAGEVSHRWPSALPDGRRLLFTIKKEGILSFDEAEIALLDIETRSWKTLIRQGSFATYIPSGHIVFARHGALLAVPFDLERGKTLGDPAIVLEGVMTEPGSGAAQYAVAREAGMLVFVPGGPDVPRRDLVWIDRQGRVSPTGAPVLRYDNVALSPDGTRVAATVWGATDAVYVYDFAGRALKRVTREGNCALQSWTTDGRRILFTSDHPGQPGSFLANADGSGDAKRLDVDFDSESFRLAVPGGHGNALAYYQKSGWWLVDIDGGTKPRLVAGMAGESASTPGNPALAPDGRWLAYDEPDSTGRREVYVRSFSAGDDRWQVSRDGGIAPRWSPRGDELFFQDGTRMKVVRVSTTGREFSSGPAADLFELPPDLEIWGLHPDGTRFLGVRVLEREFKGDRVEAILNWFDQVAARAPRTR